MSGTGSRTRPSRVLAPLGSALAALAGSADDPTRRRPRAVAFVAIVGVGLVFGAVGVAVGCAVVVAVYARDRSRRAARARQALRELNDAAPLLQLATGAGLTVRAALIATVPWLHGTLGDELARAVRHADRGGSLADELDALADHLGPSARGLLSALASADRYGAPLAGPLALAGQELRLQRRRQLEQAARRVPVRLLFPLALGVLPAFVLLAVVPLVATSLQGLSVPGG